MDGNGNEQGSRESSTGVCGQRDDKRENGPRGGPAKIFHASRKAIPNSDRFGNGTKWGAINAKILNQFVVGVNTGSNRIPT